MQLAPISHFLETYHEAIPFFSGAASLLKIFRMSLDSPCEELFKKHHFTQLKKGTLLRELSLIVPFFGNILVLIYDQKIDSNYQLALESVITDGLSLYYLLDEYKKDKRIVDQAVKENPAAFSYADEELKNDRHYVREKMVEDPSILHYAGDEIRTSESFFLEEIKNFSPTIFQYAANELLENEAFMEKVIQDSPEALKYAKKLKRNEQFVFRMVLLNESCLLYASKELRKKPDFIQELLKEKTSIFQYAADVLRRDESFINKETFKYSLLNNNKEFMLKRLREDLSFLECLDVSFRKDVKFLESIQTDDFRVLSYADKSLREDLAFNIYSVYAYHLSLFFVTDALKDNKELIFTYVALNRLNELQWAGEQVLASKECATRCFIKNPHSLKYFNPAIRKDPAWIAELLNIDLLSLTYADHSLLEDPLFILEIIKKKPQAMQFFPLKNDEAFLLKLIKKEPSVFLYFDPTIRKSRAFLLKAMRVNENVLKYADEGDLSNNPHFFLEILQKDESLFKYAGNALKKDLTFIEKFINKNPPKNSLILHDADDSIKNNRLFLERLLSWNLNPLPFASPLLRLDLSFVKKAFPSSVFENYYDHFDYSSINPSFFDDFDFLLFALKISDQVLRWATPEKKDNLILAKEALNTRSKFHALKRIELNKEIYKNYLKTNPSPLKFMGPKLKNNYEIVLMATYYDKDALDYASPELQKDSRLVSTRYKHGTGDRTSWF